jgi:hypothetical protein
MKHPILFVLVLSVYTSWGQDILDPSQATWFYHQSLNKSLPFQETVTSGQKMLLTAKALGNDSLECLAHIQLGVLFWNDGQFSGALYHLEQGRKMSEDLRIEEQVAKCMHYKGLLYY